MDAPVHSNRLSQETSPYLLQHAHNPVDWYPWGKEALARARQENRPILLSIGYSACHWCHVMAHESFEDPATAEVMNTLYINIKVDREERPDLDKVYQSAHQLLVQRSGGWPLTVILTPDDHLPFFAGTYFPHEERYGLSAFRDILIRVADFYRQHPGEIRAQNASLVQALASLQPSADTATEALTATPLDEARRELEREFDPHLGGFGPAPKFPHPTRLERLLRHWAATTQGTQPDLKALDMVRSTLHAMASGGLYDQLGGGFYRYSVDASWMIPHFEKMLYDNAPLLNLYAEAWSATGEAFYQRIAEETATWVMREMQAPQGGYYSSLDADSEGVEGRFYAWTPQDVQALLSAQDYALFAPVYGLDQPANFDGKWHLHVRRDIDEVAVHCGLSASAARQRLQAARQTLFDARENRVRPARDEKIITAWNALMIKAMAAAGRRLGRADFIASAERALDFICATLYRDARLLATCKDGHAHHTAYLDDYAFLIDAVLELLQARWRDGDLDFALALADTLLSHFEDPDEGGFFFTADDHEPLIHRPKPMLDDALPAGNGIAAQVLGRLGHLLGESRYLDACERTLRTAWPGISQLPYAHTALLLALEEYLYPPQVIVLRDAGAPHGDTPTRWPTDSPQYAPRRLCLTLPATTATLPGLLAERRSATHPLAYVCDGHRCQAPITDHGALQAVLRETAAHASPCERD